MVLHKYAAPWTILQSIAWHVDVTASRTTICSVRRYSVETVSYNSVFISWDCKKGTCKNIVPLPNDVFHPICLATSDLVDIREHGELHLSMLLEDVIVL